MISIYHLTTLKYLSSAATWLQIDERGCISNWIALTMSAAPCLRAQTFTSHNCLSTSY
jgi:hypothetical protein